MSQGKLIFISSPYSHPDSEIMEENFKIVSKFAAKLISEGFHVITPITYGHTLLQFHEMPSDWKFWKDFCLTFLQFCEEIWVYQMPGWEKSNGVREEIEFAKLNGIKIKYIKYDKSN